MNTLEVIVRDIREMSRIGKAEVVVMVVRGCLEDVVVVMVVHSYRNLLWYT